MSNKAPTKRPQPQPPLFQFSLARMLVVTTLAAGFAAVFLPGWGNDAGGWYLLGLLVLIALFVNTSYFYMQFGNNAMRAGRYDRVLAWYSRAVRYDPSNAMYQYARGGAYRAMGDADAALHDFTQATRLDPQSSYVWAGRCVVEFQRREFESALSSSTMALLLAPDDADALLVRAMTYHVLNRLDEARADFDYLLRLQPAAGNVYWWRGALHSDAGRCDEALDDFRQAEIHGCSDDMAMSRSITLFRIGRYEEALAQTAAFVATHPQHAGALAVQAFFLATCPDDALRDGRRALELCQRAQSIGGLAPWEFDASFAAAYAELGRFEEAVAHGEAALALAPPYRQDVYQARLEAYRHNRPWRSDT